MCFSEDPTKYEFICEFKDVLIYKNNPLQSSSNKTLKVNLYSVEPTCAKTLGKKLKNVNLTKKNEQTKKMLIVDFSKLDNYV